MTTTVKSLGIFAKEAIVQGYKDKITLKRLAELHHTSPRTIGRVLEERGLLTPVPRLKGEAHNVMKGLASMGVSSEDALSLITVLKAHNIAKPAALIEKIQQPALTRASVQAYMNQCSKEELATHFYASGLVKLAEITKEANERKKQQQAALFKPAVQSPLRFPANGTAAQAVPA